MAWFRRRKKDQDPSPEAQSPEPESSPDQPEEDAPEPPPQEAAPIPPEPEPAPEAQAPPEPEPEPEPQPQETPAASQAEEQEPAPAKGGFFKRMFQRLGKTREKLGGSLDRITLGRVIDDEVLDELEEVLVTADLGVTTSLELIEGLRGKVRRQELDDVAALKLALRQGIDQMLADAAPIPSRDNQPHVIMVVGVNGVGKTTTIGKLAHYFTAQNKKVILGAADTFRAAAGEQLEVWADRAGCPIVRQQEGADPSAVAFDTVEAALARGRDLAIIDTAGRLHTKVNLMDELKKIHRVIGKRLPGAPHEVLLVLDATTGQNALAQAKQFHQDVPLTGLVLTKLDGTAKGGVVVAITREMKLPICFVGLGESINDLQPFNPDDFTAALL